MITMTTLGRLTSGQSTVDTESTNEGCDNGGDYTSLLRELLAGQKRLEARLQQQNCPGESNPDDPRESRIV